MKLLILIFTLILCYSAANNCKNTRDSLASKRLIGGHIPQCQQEDESKYKIFQCHGSTWYCWCVDEITNEPWTEPFRPMTLRIEDFENSIKILEICNDHKKND